MSAEQPDKQGKQGKLIVITGPSGVGKGTLVQFLLQRHPQLRVSISATTRAPRLGEVEGVDYYFLNKKDFETAIL
ncbi:MAG: guanylate kinase, partial [Waterburya sp.]